MQNYKKFKDAVYKEKKVPAQAECLLFGDVHFERLPLYIFMKHINIKFLQI